MTDLEIGQQYIVQAVEERDGGLWFFLPTVAESDYPYPYPAEFFEVQDYSLIPGWCVRFDTQQGNTVIKRITFSEWANDEHFYERLLDGEIASVSAYRRNERRGEPAIMEYRQGLIKRLQERDEWKNMSLEEQQWFEEIPNNVARALMAFDDMPVQDDTELAAMLHAEDDVPIDDALVSDSIVAGLANLLEVFQDGLYEGGQLAPGPRAIADVLFEAVENGAPLPDVLDTHDFGPLSLQGAMTLCAISRDRRA